MNQGLLMNVLEVAEKAAIASAEWNGLGDKNAADQAATSAMREAFNEIQFSGTVVIGEGERDEAPMLYIGEELGLGGDSYDIAVDPLEGTNLCATNQPNAITTIALAPEGTLLSAPDIYMQKVACGSRAKGSVSVDNSPTQNVTAVAEALGKPVSEVNVMVLDRERHSHIMKELREIGCRVRLISDGDVYGCMATALPGSGIDLYLGSGGAPEGVLACVALKAIGGFFEGRLLFESDEQLERAKSGTDIDVEGVLDMDTLVQTDDAAFVAVGVTEGELLPGVKRIHGTLETTGIIINGFDKTLKFVKTQHLG